jgi:hypothetical protein
MKRIPSSVRLVIATWVAAVLGALAGRSLAEGTHARGHAAASLESTHHSNVVSVKQIKRD